jgi:rhodanese-related sulfurtransferase
VDVSIAAQIARLCVCALVLSAGLAAVRGLPSLAASDSASAEPGACRAPAQPDANSPVRFIDQDQAKTLVGAPGVVFVDCRPRAEFEEGHVSGAVHLDPTAGAKEGDRTLPPAPLELLSRAGTVITYCDARAQCERSLLLAERLRAAGLRDVRVLEDGMPAWLARGYPAESGICAQCEADRP